MGVFNVKELNATAWDWMEYIIVVISQDKEREVLSSLIGLFK
jgi:hypothetical protein